MAAGSVESTHLSGNVPGDLATGPFAAQTTVTNNIVNGQAQLTLANPFTLAGAPGTLNLTAVSARLLNSYSQHWQVPNLFVLGASAFPHNPGPNPTPTVLAMAYRTADAIVDRYLKRPGLLV